jgi:broad specificity phosphatase PhoE
MNKPCSIYIVRHGETDWNLMGIWQGHTDIPLNATGRAQAKQLGEQFSAIPFKAVYASDLSRARQTAEIMMVERGFSIETYPSLRELEHKPLEGKKLEELPREIRQAFTHARSLPYEQYLRHKWHPEVESPAECYQRIVRFLQERCTAFAGETILIVSHGSVMRILMEHLQHVPEHTWKVSNTGFIQLAYDSQELKLVRHFGLKSAPF